MIANNVKRKLAAGDTVFGPMILDLTGPGLPAMMRNAGADFVMYDMEAGCLGLPDVKMQAALCRGLGVAPMVNTASDAFTDLTQPLDAGALGLMVPLVESAAQAHKVVEATRYPPAGRRGVAFGIAHDDYQIGDMAAKANEVNHRTLVVAKIETAAGVAVSDDILAVDGIDVAFIGHMDLSVSLGIPGGFDQPRFSEAVKQVATACREHGKALGCLVGSPIAARRWMDRGARFIIYSTDVALITGALSSALAGLRVPA
ncbi:MAG: HpcH/HpaI aldolase family protein [Propylenella sp.]